jgi:hypothetical protein
MVKPDLVRTDGEMAKMFVSHVLYGRFHLDILKMSMRTKTAIFPEVLDCVSEGLRTIVNAYSYIKLAADVGTKPARDEMITIEFDDEEQELLASSMRDAYLES